MLLIDEGELSSGLQQETLEDMEVAIHPASHLHVPKRHCTLCGEYLLCFVFSSRKQITFLFMWCEDRAMNFKAIYKLVSQVFKAAK